MSQSSTAKLELPSKIPFVLPAVKLQQLNFSSKADLTGTVSLDSKARSDTKTFLNPVKKSRIPAAPSYLPCETTPEKLSFKEPGTAASRQFIPPYTSSPKTSKAQNSNFLKHDDNSTPSAIRSPGDYGNRTISAKSNLGPFEKKSNLDFPCNVTNSKISDQFFVSIYTPTPTTSTHPTQVKVPNSYVTRKNSCSSAMTGDFFYSEPPVRTPKSARFETYMMTGDVILNIDPVTKAPSRKVEDDYEGDNKFDFEMNSCSTYHPAYCVAHLLPQRSSSPATNGVEPSSPKYYLSGDLYMDTNNRNDNAFPSLIRDIMDGEHEEGGEGGSFGSGDTYIHTTTPPQDINNNDNNNNNESLMKTSVTPSKDASTTKSKFKNNLPDTPIPYLNSRSGSGSCLDDSTTTLDLKSSGKIRALRQSVERHRLRSRGSATAPTENNFFCHNMNRDTEIVGSELSFHPSEYAAKPKVVHSETIIPTLTTIPNNDIPLMELISNTKLEFANYHQGEEVCKAYVKKESNDVKFNQFTATQIPLTTLPTAEASGVDDAIKGSHQKYNLAGKIPKTADFKRKDPQEYAVWTINNDRDFEAIAAGAAAKMAFRHNKDNPKASDSDYAPEASLYSDSYEDSSTTKSRSGSLGLFQQQQQLLRSEMGGGGGLLGYAAGSLEDNHRITSERIAKIERRRALAKANKARKLQMCNETSAVAHQQANNNDLCEDYPKSEFSIQLPESPKSQSRCRLDHTGINPVYQNENQPIRNGGDGGKSADAPHVEECETSSPQPKTAPATYNIVRNEYYVIERETAERFLSAFKGAGTDLPTPSTTPTTRNLSYRTSILNNDSSPRPNAKSSITPTPPSPTFRNPSDPIKQFYHRIMDACNKNLIEENVVIEKMYQLVDFNKSEVAQLLNIMAANSNDRMVDTFFNEFAFEKVPLDVALRNFFTHVSLVGDTNDKEKTLKSFSKHYYQFNPNSFMSEDALHGLVCALVLLNTDFYICNYGKKMSCKEFITNLEALGPNGKSYDKAVLKKLYHSVKNKPLQGGTEKVCRAKKSLEDSQMTDSKYHNLIKSKNNRLDCGDDRAFEMSVLSSSLPDPCGYMTLNNYLRENMYLTVPPPNFREDMVIKQGFLRRKCCQDPNGKKPSFIKRSWKTFFATLKGRVLYLNKCGDTSGPKFDDTNEFNSIRIHHALTSRVPELAQKSFVFQLQTADWAIYYFQAGNPHELSEWIEVLNLVAATFSANPEYWQIDSNVCNRSGCPAQAGHKESFNNPFITKRSLKSDGIAKFTETISTTSSSFATSTSPSRKFVGGLKKFLSGSNLQNSGGSSSSNGCSALSTPNASSSAKTAPFSYTATPVLTNTAPHPPANTKGTRIYNHSHRLKRFHRPILPSLPTKYCTRDQLEHHESMVNNFEEQLKILRETPPAPQWKTREIFDYKERENYFLFQLKRYKTYSNLLRKKLSFLTDSNHDKSNHNNNNSKDCTLSSATCDSKPIPSLSEEKRRSSSRHANVNGISNGDQRESRHKLEPLEPNGIEGETKIKAQIPSNSASYHHKHEFKEPGPSLKFPLLGATKLIDTNINHQQTPVHVSNGHKSAIPNSKDRYSYKAAIYKNDTTGRNYF